MKRFSKILLIAGGENWRERALERAVSLATENQADLTVLEVIELSGDLRVMSRKKRDALVREIIGKRLAYLDNKVQHVRGMVEIQTRVIPGTAFLEIIREVLRNSYDLVMKMSGGRRQLNNLLLGSTDMHLLRKCPCPVWIMKQDEPEQYRRVLAAVDMESESGEQQARALNRQILEMASSLALSEFAELHIVHAWMRNVNTILDGIGFDVDDAEVESWGEKTRQLHRAWLDDQRRRLQNTLGDETMTYLAPALHLIEGETCEVITEFIEEKKVDVIVMGTVARTGIAGFFMGNTAESILNSINCSMLAVKPPGFETPVTLPDGQ